MSLGSQTLTLSNATGSYAGVIGGSGGVALTAGSQTLTGINTYTGTTTINGGTLQIGGTGQLGSGTYTGAITIGTGATFEYSSSANQTVSGQISGAGALTKDTAAGTLTVSGSNGSYTGVTTINSGTLKVENVSALGSGSVTVGSDANSKATLDLNGKAITNALILNGKGVDVGSNTGTLGALTNSGSSGVTLASNAVTLNTTSVIGGANSITLGGVVSGAGLTKVGTNTLTLTNGANTYSGATAINGGTLALTGTGSIGTSSGVIQSGNSVFDISGLSGNGATIKSLTGSSTAENGVNLVAKTLTISNGNGSYSGVIGGAGGLALLAGTQTLAAVNTYKGATTISGGTLIIANKGSIASSSGVTKSGSGVFTQLVESSKSNQPAINMSALVSIIYKSQMQYFGVNTMYEDNRFKLFSRFVKIDDDARFVSGELGTQNDPDRNSTPFIVAR